MLVDDNVNVVVVYKSEYYSKCKCVCEKGLLHKLYKHVSAWTEFMLCLWSVGYDSYSFEIFKLYGEQCAALIIVTFKWTPKPHTPHAEAVKIEQN